MLKSTFTWVTTLSLTIRVYLAVVAPEICEITRNSLKIRTYTVQGHPRSSIQVSIKNACNFLLVINSNFGRISQRFRDIDAFSLFFLPQPCLTLHGGRTPCDINVIYTPQKSTFSGLQLVALIVGLSSFVQPLLHSKIAKSREIPTKFDLIAVQGHARSSILVSIESSHATSYQSLIVTLVVSATIFEILKLKARKWLVFPIHPLFDASLEGNPLKFPDETYPAKTRGIGLP